LAYIARCINKGDAVKPGKELLPHQEPTWGDRRLVLDAVGHLQPTNVASLRSGLLMAAIAPDHLRIVRNACAHISTATLAEVEKLKIYYYGSEYRHPAELLMWRDIATDEYAFSLWISELLAVAEDMTV
jgi:hypothetical protein